MTAQSPTPAFTRPGFGPSRSVLSADPAREVEWRFPSDARSVGLSRRRLRDQAHVWKIPAEATDTAVLLLSELMTNAWQYGNVPPGSRISTRWAVRDGMLHIEVSDWNSAFPQSGCPTDGDESGRGMALVSALANESGAYSCSCGVGKTVWFAIRIASRGSSAP
jgi:anti-sigma regulatory factor (Ser/Thr protein kinase)